MKTSSNASKRNTGSTSTKAKSRRVGKVRIGVESAESFFTRMRANARRLDRGEALAPGLSLSFEDPADLLEVITPARLRLLQTLGEKEVPLIVLANALSRDPSAVRRDIALLENNHLVRTRKVPNPGHGTHTVVERAAPTITLAATV